MEDGSVRKMREEWEKQMLSPYATLAVNTRGREEVEAVAVGIGTDEFGTISIASCWQED